MRNMRTKLRHTFILAWWFSNVADSTTCMCLIIYVYRIYVMLMLSVIARYQQLLPPIFGLRAVNPKVRRPAPRSSIFPRVLVRGDFWLFFGLHMSRCQDFQALRLWVLGLESFERHQHFPASNLKRSFVHQGVGEQVSWPMARLGSQARERCSCG